MIYLDVRESYTIRPADIDASDLTCAFRNKDAQKAAEYIVRMCQSRSSWSPFTEEEIQNFFEQMGGEGKFSFADLVIDDSSLEYFKHEDPNIPGGYIGKRGNIYLLSTDLVNRLHRISPVKREKKRVPG